MIVMSEKEYFEEIIYRHLNREASPQEETELSSWLNERRENREEYEILEKIWKESSNLAFAEDFDKLLAWESLEKKINRQHIHDEKRGFQFSSLLKIAAAVISLAILSGLAYYIFRTRTPAQIQILSLLENQKVEMPDGSVIFLRKNSSIRYNKDYPQNGRLVELSGEAYFEVLHDESRPFTIQTNKSSIRVLGTSFLVRSTDQAEQIFVTQGKVRVSEKKDQSNTIILTTGQTVSIIGNIFDKGSITDNNYISWQSGVLQFDHVPLKKLIIDLNQNYQSDIILSDSLAARSDTIKVNFRFENNSLDQVLEEIHVTTGWIVERKENKIIIRE